MQSPLVIVKIVLFISHIVFLEWRIYGLFSLVQIKLMTKWWGWETTRTIVCDVSDRNKSMLKRFLFNWLEII